MRIFLCDNAGIVPVAVLTLETPVRSSLRSSKAFCFCRSVLSYARGCAPEALAGHLNGTVPVFPTVSNFSLVPPQFTTVVRSFNFGWRAEFVQK
jgi:hypothetical protein